MKKKNVVSLAMVCVMVLGLGITSLAAPVIESSGGTGNSAVEVSVEVPTFSVTVPTNLAVNMDKDGMVSTADNAKIINNSHGAVKVNNVEIEAVESEEWTMVSFQTDMTKVKADSKQMGFMINDCETDAEGQIAFDAAKFPKLDGENTSDSDELSIDYDAVLSPSSETITDKKIADVIFTIGWDN